LELDAIAASITATIDRQNTASTPATTTGWEDVPYGTHVQQLDNANFEETIEGNCCVTMFFHAECE